MLELYTYYSYIFLTLVSSFVTQICHSKLFFNFLSQVLLLKTFIIVKKIFLWRISVASNITWGKRKFPLHIWHLRKSDLKMFDLPALKIQGFTWKFRLQFFLIKWKGVTKLGLNSSRDWGNGTWHSNLPLSHHHSYPLITIHHLFFRIFITFIYRKLNSAYWAQLGGQFLSLGLFQCEPPTLDPGCCLPSEGG